MISPILQNVEEYYAGAQFLSNNVSEFRCEIEQRVTIIYMYGLPMITHISKRLIKCPFSSFRVGNDLKRPFNAMYIGSERPCACDCIEYAGTIPD